MRHHRMVSVLGALSLGLTGMAATTSATAAPTDSTGSTTTSASSGPEHYVVLAERGGSAAELAERLEAKGATVTSVNDQVGMVTVTSSKADFAEQARAMDGVFGAASEGVVGRSPEPKKDSVERPGKGPGFGDGKAKGPGNDNNGKGKYKKGTADPLDDKLWGMDMINAREAHKTEAGDKRVTVGIMDTGVDASHPDIAPNFNHKLSRNFVTDIPAIDGPCEVESCVDPADVDEGGHGTHVAGTVAAAMNGVGDFSNYTTDIDSGQIEVAAPGGDAYDWPNATGANPESMVLSSVPENVVKAEGSVDEDGNITEYGEGWVLKDCTTIKGQEECGYYEYYQGTSMASPHAAGVSALIVSAHGTVNGQAGFGLDADTTKEILMDSARNTPCPEPSLYDYPAPIPEAYNAQCVGDADFNGFYGDGIVDAAAAVR